MISADKKSAGTSTPKKPTARSPHALPMLTKRLPSANRVESESDAVVAKATVTHSEGGSGRKTARKLISDLRRKDTVKSKVRGPTVDTSRAKSSCDVVRFAIKDLGWRDCQNGRKSGCSFYWLCGQFEIPDTSNTGFMNKFPGMSEATHKVEFSRQLERMKRFFPDRYGFYPKTWMLPEQYAELLADVSRNKTSKMFIVKPDGGSQGEGIFLMNNPLDVHLGTSLVRPVVVQEYIVEPFLLEKFKFDLRIYVVLKSLDPLGIYICREGMARFCTEHYQAPSPKNMHKVYMHLTNYSLNKHSSTYIHSDADDKGSKRKLSAVFEQLAAKGHDIPKLWSDIDGVICKTIIALVPLLKLHGQVAEMEVKHPLRCFQILGFDILLDKQLQPILLEVNSSPSMRIDFEEETDGGRRVEAFVSLTDLEIKAPIVRDTMQLVWQSRFSTGNGPDAAPESCGCLEEIYPKLAPEFRHMRMVERCLALFKHFVGVRMSDRMGPTSFRMLARQCKLIDFGYTLAATEILFINLSRRHSADGNPRASLGFNGFCEALLVIGHKKLNGSPIDEPINTLMTILHHCESQLNKAQHSTFSRRRFVKHDIRHVKRAQQSCFRANAPVREGLL